MLRQFALISALLISVIFADAAQADNNCSCPTIKADGKGNTSCSASESGGRCTIDYNLFGPVREGRAFDLLKSLDLSVDLVKPDPSLNSQTAIANASAQGQTFPVVLLYLTVATADQLAAFPDTIKTDTLREILTKLSESWQDKVIDAFSPDRAVQEPLPPEDAPGAVLFDESGIVLAPGCVEVLQDGQWMMFKVPWSPVALAPQCGGATGP